MEFEWCQDLPKLILGTYLTGPKDQRVGRVSFITPFKTRHIFHQTAGMGCSHEYIIGTELNPTDEASVLMGELNQKYFDTSLGILHPHLEDLNAYEEILDRYELTSNISYHLLKEGIYPIDCDQSSLSKLTSDDLPDPIDQILVRDSDFRFPIFLPLTLFVLGPNCD